ncbi:class III extradiol ring-cleavage dioxygenase [Oleiagrimonas sp. C23AA]|uniref:DODA-type extradiol aromatic ring-opening family dioxygenase n=1 Tax=Oleiagrimonas sp. C23AA TaxID=2719047 RepID=UPI00142085ED|nr:class III extradiol ring-cleavage dioxygenase [Oleiagrimonas sp. C23AA]NII09310.1 dioxygenase [Oleiagrimonas sp. C23AA]
MPVLPTLFISHGSPMLALSPGRTGQHLGSLARRLPRPRAVLIASAHWLTPAPTLGSATAPQTLHDFAGFPDTLYHQHYPAPGDPALAAEVVGRLADVGLEATLDEHRGFDHGAWIPLQLMYPQADIPVCTLSLQPARSPAHHLALGRALAGLNRDRVLVIGSGSVTHNLGDLRPGALPAAYVRDFTDWIDDALADSDIPALLDYRQRAPHAVRAHPSDEHLLPLFVALGAAGAGCHSTRLHAGVDLGALAMDIYRFDAAA